ncbi:MAG: hypothetical protein ACE5MM_01035 [Nitrospiraceae bacterium]
MLALLARFATNEGGATAMAYGLIVAAAWPLVLYNLVLELLSQPPF